MSKIKQLLEISKEVEAETEMFLDMQMRYLREAASMNQLLAELKNILNAHVELECCMHPQGFECCGSPVMKVPMPKDAMRSLQDIVSKYSGEEPTLIPPGLDKESMREFILGTPKNN